MNIQQRMNKIFSEAFDKCGYGSEYGMVSRSSRPDICDYACSGALQAGKKLGRNPLDIAGEVADSIADKDVEVSVAPPGFINIRLTDEFLRVLMDRLSEEVTFLVPEIRKRRIVLDYGGPNVAKPLHVGHLRSALIGDAMYRTASFLGCETISDTHLGDWGLQMGLVIAEVERTNPRLPYFDEAFTGEYPEDAPFTLDDLNEIYPAASARSKEDKAFAAHAAQITLELQNGKHGYFALWEKMCEVSKAGLVENYSQLGVNFDYWYGESDADKYIGRTIELLEDKGLLSESDGARVVEIKNENDAEPMPPIIVVKSNGAVMYGATDLATIVQRREDWNPDEIWYFADARQILHFKQVFRCAEISGISEGIKCEHIHFGTMNGKDRKPYKTRDGGVMKLSDMIELVATNAREKLELSDKSLIPEETEATALKVGIAALKIGDLMNHRTKDYVFDLEKFLSTEGKTGAYLQYTAVRIGSLLAKASEWKKGIRAELSENERRVVVAVIYIYDSLLTAFEDKTPSTICDSLFMIANSFNTFYNDTRILACEDEEKKASMLSLADTVKKVMTAMLGLLGVEVPDRM